MFGYIMVGTNDKERAVPFYDELMKELGCQRLYEIMHITAWGTSPDQPQLMVCTPLNKKEATVGNGSMVALALPSREDVDRLHAKALSLGAKNAGDPGDRPGGMYCAYFRDLDGNKFNFHAAG